MFSHRIPRRRLLSSLNHCLRSRDGYWPRPLSLTGPTVDGPLQP